MAAWLALSAADLAPLAAQWSSYEHLLALEFAGLDVGQAYELAFSRLLKPDPFRLFGRSDGDPQQMFGTDQRDRLVAPAAAALAGLPAGASLLDIGCGDGQTTALVLAARRAPIALQPLDPVGAYLERYRRLMGEVLPHARILEPLEGDMNEVLASGSLAGRFDAALLLHSIYFTEDPERLLSRVLDCLAPGGLAVLASAARRAGYSGDMRRGYLDAFGLDPDGRVAAGQARLDALLGLADPEATPDGLTRSMRDRLGRGDFAVVSTVWQETRFYAHDFGDLIAMSLITGLLTADADRPRQIRYVSGRLQREPETFDLRLELAGPHARTLSVAQPQVVVTLARRQGRSGGPGADRPIIE